MTKIIIHNIICRMFIRKIYFISYIQSTKKFGFPLKERNKLKQQSGVV